MQAEKSIPEDAKQRLQLKEELRGRMRKSIAEQGGVWNPPNRLVGARLRFGPQLLQPRLSDSEDAQEAHCGVRQRVCMEGRVMDFHNPDMAQACPYAYSSDPVLDAGRYYDAADDLQARRDAKRSEIVRMFTQDVRVVGPKSVIVPSAVTHREQRPEWHTVSANMFDLLSYDDISALFDAVLQSSDCPLVAALRKGAAERYANNWVDELVRGAD